MTLLKLLSCWFEICIITAVLLIISKRGEQAQTLLMRCIHGYVTYCMDTNSCEWLFKNHCYRCESDVSSAVHVTLKMQLSKLIQLKSVYCWEKS